MKFTLSLLIIIIGFSAAAIARQDLGQAFDQPVKEAEQIRGSGDGKTIDALPEDVINPKKRTDENFYYHMISTGLLYTEEKPAKFYLNKLQGKDNHENGPEDSEAIEFINSPNPFSSYVQIRYTAPGPAHVTLAIYNIRGEQVALLVDQDKPGGEYVLYYDGLDKEGKSLPEGFYIFRLQVGGRQVTSKALLSR